MSDSIFISERVINCPSDSDHSLTQNQLLLSQTLQNFCSEAISPSALIGLTAGRALACLVKAHSFRLLPQLLGTSSSKNTVYHYISVGIGCVIEGVCFPMASELARSGELKIGSFQENLHGFLTIVLCKGLAKGVVVDSLLVQHGVQDIAMSLFDEKCEEWGLLEKQQISFCQRVLMAEVISLRMESSAKFLGVICRKVSHHEATCNLQNESLKTERSNFSKNIFRFKERLSEIGKKFSPQLLPAEGILNSAIESSNHKTSLILAMTKKGEGEGQKNVESEIKISSTSQEKTQRTVAPHIQEVLDSLGIQNDFRLPLLFGILHFNDDPLSAKRVEDTMTVILKRAYAKGAKTVGLEITESMLNHPYFYNYFNKIADLSELIGLKVIPLKSQSVYDQEMVVETGRSYISDQGGFDRVALNESIARHQSNVDRLIAEHDSIKGSENELQKAELEEEIAIEKQWLERRWSLKILLEEIHYDMKEYGAEWKRVIADLSTAEMQENIIQSRPDVIIIGEAHAELMESKLGYQSINYSRSLNLKLPMGLDTSIDQYPHIQKSIQGMRNFTANLGLEVLKLVISKTFLGLLSPSEKLKALDQAFAVEPLLIPLLFRSKQSSLAPFIFPPTDYEVLKIGVEEAEKRVKRALQKAAYL